MSSLLARYELLYYEISLIDLKKSINKDTEQIIEIPIRITYLLESTKEIVEQQEHVLPIPVDDEIINGMHEEALFTGKSYEEIASPIVTRAVAENMARDQAKQDHLAHIAKEHKTNILTEVSITGKVVVPRTSGAKRN